MTWLAWRQFRVQALAGAIGVALLGAVLLATGPGLADEYADGLALCGSDCREFKDLFTDQHQAALLAITAIVLLLPALLGAVLGRTTRGARAGRRHPPAGLEPERDPRPAGWASSWCLVGVAVRDRRRGGHLGCRPVVGADRRRRRCRSRGSRSR